MPGRARSGPPAAAWSAPLRRLGALALMAVLALGTFTATVGDAEAKRMGGGRSFGRQAPLMQRQATPPQAAQPRAQQPAAGAAAAKPANRWLGPLAGLAAGLGIAALLSHLGLGGALAGLMSNLIVIALLGLVVFWVLRLLARRRAAAQPAYAHSAARAGSGADFEASPVSRQPWEALPEASTQASRGALPGALPSWAATSATSTMAASEASVDSASGSRGVPADFDSEAFLRSAKVHFVRLQASWDAGNLADIREFTTPEMFGEIKVDLDERGAAPNVTDVVKLDAELLGVEERGDESFASVRFHGLMRESQGAAAESFAEIWNLSRHARRDEGWLLAGIQQTD